MESPKGIARLGYGLIIAIGALVVAISLLGGLLVLPASDVFGCTTAFALLVIGLILVRQSIRALNFKRWQRFHLPSVWTWFGLMIIVWIAGVLSPTLPLPWDGIAFALILVLGAFLPALFFMRATVDGLQAPAGRSSLSDKLAPRHTVFLSLAFSALFSTIGSIVLEGLLIVAMMRALLATSYLVGDQPTFQFLLRAIQDPNTQERLEEMIAQSPAAFLSLGYILVFIAPAVEEMMKSLPLLFFARQRFITERTAILLGAAAGMGFAFAENIGYLSFMSDAWPVSFWLRTCCAVGHGVSSGFVGRAWYRGARLGQWQAMFFDLLKGWGLHAFWNFLALWSIWLAYKGIVIGVLFILLIGIVPLATLFTLLARWGIWVSEK